MFDILTADSYQGYSAPLESLKTGAKNGAQPIFVGRMVWPGQAASEDAVIKLYESCTCGTANEVIGYIANALLGISQPKKGAILLLSKRELPPLPGIDLDQFIDVESGLTACWATSLEQGAHPFRFIRRLSSFTEKQSQAFYKSRFCRQLASVDHVTGNSDRHEGNFLYIDDLNYIAIDQGCIGGSMSWHTMWPDNDAKNEILELARKHLNSSQLAHWHTSTLLEHEAGRTSWPTVTAQISIILTGLLAPQQIGTIIEYMELRANGNRLAESCGKLF